MLENESKMEIFKDIPGYPYYQISNLGRIWNAKTQRYLKASKMKNGYYQINLVAINGKRKKELKELLLLALSQPQDGKPEEDNYMGITVALIQKALKGDTKAFEIIRDTIGQKPIEQLDINSNKININITGDEND